MNGWINKYKSLDAVGRMVALNVVVWIATQLYDGVLTLLCVRGYAWENALALHSNLNDFVLTPWTIVTYMFVHAGLTQDVFHIVFNLLVLYWFGRLYLRWHTGRQFLGLYLTGGLVAGIFFLVVYNAFPYFAIERYHTVVIGASGAILALLTASAVERPDDEIGVNLLLLRATIRMKWLALLIVVVACCGTSGGGLGGGIVCHVGGVLWGLLYGAMARRGVDLADGFGRMADRVTNLFKRRTKMDVHRGGAHVWPADRQKDMDYNARRREEEARIDAILDKMRTGGYNGLTEEEKRTLFNAGKK